MKIKSRIIKRRYPNLLNFPVVVSSPYRRLSTTLGIHFRLLGKDKKRNFYTIKVSSIITKIGGI